MTEREQIEQIVEKIPKRISLLLKNSNKKFIRFETQISEINPLAWLDAQTEFPKIYFEGRERDDGIIAGMGAIKIIEGESENNILKEILSEVKNNNIRYYGGISFPEKERGKEWKSFGKIKFIIPEFEMIKRDKKTVFVCNIRRESYNEDSFRKRLKEIIFNIKDFTADIQKPINTLSFPEYEEWERRVKEIIDEINEDKYEKIVLARKQIYEFEKSINPFMLLERLKQKLRNRYVFLYQFENNAAFLGVSMERLYKRIKDEIKTEAIAGTINRQDEEKNDNIHLKTLLASEKDNKEQAFVEDFIEEKLAQICKEYKRSDKKVLKLKESFHLKTEFYGNLKKNISDIDIIEKLHPTPAVGGSPKEKVENLIYKKENFSRGWYAGLVGYISDERTDFSVALRSALIYNNKLSLYTGVGLVKDSEADKEWKEGDWKLKNFKEIFEK